MGATKYTFRGEKFYIGDAQLALFGDTIVVDENNVQNLTNRSCHASNLPQSILDKLLESCQVVVDDIDEEDFKAPEIPTDKDVLLEQFLSVPDNVRNIVDINKYAIKRLIVLGIIKTTKTSCRDYNVGKSNYSKHVIQPWAVWQDYGLNPWDADIVKRVLRTKTEEGMSEADSRILDYEKIIHICQERIRQLKD